MKNIDIDDNAFKSIEAIIYSMTPQERTHPEILNGSRRTRIAKGSGTNIQEVNRLLKQFDQTRKMMKMVTGSKMAGMMQKMQKILKQYRMQGSGRRYRPVISRMAHLKKRMAGLSGMSQSLGISRLRSGRTELIV